MAPRRSADAFECPRLLYKQPMRQQQWTHTPSRHLLRLRVGAAGLARALCHVEALVVLHALESTAAGLLPLGLLLSIGRLALDLAGTREGSVNLTCNGRAQCQKLRLVGTRGIPRAKESAGGMQRHRAASQRRLHGAAFVPMVASFLCASLAEQKHKLRFS